MCKLMTKVGYIFAGIDSFKNPPSWWRHNSWRHDMRWCHDNDVMIGPLSTGSCLPCDMPITWLIVIWSANRRFNIYRKNTRHVFMNEMEHFERSDRFELWASDIQDGIHACLAYISCHRLENSTTIFLHFVSWIPMILISCRSSQKMYWVGDFNAFWTRVGRVTGTKQLFCHGLRVWIWKIWLRYWLEILIHYDSIFQ